VSPEYSKANSLAVARSSLKVVSVLLSLRFIFILLIPSSTSPENPLRVIGREGDSPTEITQSSIGRILPLSARGIGADQHFDSPVALPAHFSGFIALELRLAEGACMDPVTRHTGLSQRVTNGVDTTLAQGLVVCNGRPTGERLLSNLERF
jgi:hypothetical protein